MKRYQFAKSIFVPQIDREKAFKLRAGEFFISYHVGDIVSLIPPTETKLLLEDGLSIEDMFDYCMDNNINEISDKIVAEVHSFDSRHSKSKLNKEQKDYYFDPDAALRNGRDLVKTFKEDKISKFYWCVIVSIYNIGTGEIKEELLFEEGGI